MNKRLVAGLMAGALVLGGVASAELQVEIPPSKRALDAGYSVDGSADVVADVGSEGAAAVSVDLSAMGYEELVALKEQINAALAGLNAADSKPLLYEDDVVSIRYSDIHLEKVGDSAYLKSSFLFENKTPNEIEVVCMTIIINGCAVYLSKFVDIPSDCVYIHEWTTDAETFLQYGIESIDTVSITFNVENGENIRSDTVSVSE